MTRMGRFLLALPLALLVVSGCSTSNTPASVSGKVSYKGAPVPAGSLTFHTQEGGIYSYSLRNAEYSGTDLPVGEMIVTVETESANPKPVKKVAMPGGKQDPSDDYRKRMMEQGNVPQGAANAGEYVPIPPKYGTKDKSPLRVTLTKGNNEYNIELTD